MTANAEVRTTDFWLLMWCGVVVAELLFLTSLTMSPLWLVLGIVLYWPIRDGLRGAVKHDDDPEELPPDTGDSNTTSAVAPTKE